MRPLPRLRADTYIRSAEALAMSLPESPRTCFKSFILVFLCQNLQYVIQAVLYQLPGSTMIERTGPTDTSSRVDTSPSRNPSLHPYSCLTCRNKKKRCDRVYPCTNCFKGGSECIFVPRRPSTRQKLSLSAMERLGHLEDVIKHMRKDLEGKSPQPLVEMGKAAEQSTNEIKNIPTDPSSHGQNSMGRADGLETEFGRLAIGEGRSRYITSNFWASLNEEVRHSICTTVSS